MTSTNANVDTEDEYAATVANPLRMRDGTDESGRTATTTPPFFRLPRELRDEIYELMALSGETLDYEIELRADMPAQKAAFIDRGACRTFSDSQFEVEFSAAAERRVKSLMTGGDRGGLRLSGSVPQDPELRGTVAVVAGRGLMTKAKEIWLEVSKGLCADGHVSRNIHAIVLAIALRGPNGPDNKTIQLESRVIFRFQFPDKADLGPRQRLDCYWDMSSPIDGNCLYFQSDDGSLAQQVLSVTKEVNWKGSVREYMMWQRYIVKYVYKGPYQTFF